jgi:hypothetical protein
MEEKFTVQEFRNYIESQDSLGDVLYYLSAENIRKANPQETEEKFHDDCKFYDYAQGRGLCTCNESQFVSCAGVCECFEPKNR